MALATNAGETETPSTKGVLHTFAPATWALADQVLISGTNFVTTILLARTLTPDDFGDFVLVYLLLLFVNSIQLGLITQPHNVLGARRRGEDYVCYTASTAISQFILAITATLLAFAGWAVTWWFDSAVWPLLLALPPVILAWQAHEFARRVLYTERRVAAALFVDLVSYGGQTFTIVALLGLHALSGVSALYVIAITFALGAVVGCWLIRHSLKGSFDLSVLRQNWDFGKWLAGGEILSTWLCGELFVVLGAAALGAGAAGILRVVNTVFGPTRIVTYVANTVLPIGLSRTLADKGEKALRRQFRAACLVVMPAIGGYCLTAALFAGPVLWLFYGDKYLDAAPVLRLFAAYIFVNYMGVVLSTALKAKQLTFGIFISRLTTCLVTIPLGALMIVAFGIYGAVLGMMLNSLLLSLLYWRSYVQVCRERGADFDEDMAMDSGTDQALPAQNGWQVSGEHATSNGAALLPAGASCSANAGQILLRILKLFDKADIPYCLLHGYEGYPERIKSDVDGLIAARVDPRQLVAFLRDNSQRIGAEVVRQRGHHVLLMGHNLDGSFCFVDLDLSVDYVLNDRRFYAGAEILRSRRWHHHFWVPEPKLEFGCYLVRKIAKGSLSVEQGRRLSSLYQQDPLGCKGQIARFWAPARAKLIEQSAASGDWERVWRDLGTLRAELLRRTLLRQPWTVVGNRLRHLAGRAGRFLRANSGMEVVILGPDGAGKSSVTAVAQRALAPAFRQTIYQSFPPALLRRLLRRPSGPIGLPHALPLRSFTASVARALGYWLPYYVLTHATTLHLALARSALVIHDRHFADTLVDPRRYRYGGPAWLLRLIWRIMPRPDLVILLDAPPEVLQDRKKEVPFAETARQRERYLSLLGTMRNGHIVNAAETPEHVALDVSGLIMQHQARRIVRRLDLEKGAAASERLHAAVNRVLQQFTASTQPDWQIEQVDEGLQATIFAVRRKGRLPVWKTYPALVVKVFKPSPLVARNFLRDQFHALAPLHTSLDGSMLDGWKVCLPQPLYLCEPQMALVMTLVPGKSLKSYLKAPGQLPPETLESIGRVVATAMERCWAINGQMHGDLTLDNILCDMAGRRISLVDPGVTLTGFHCDGVARDWYPASRELANLLYDTVVAVKRSLGQRGARRRQEYVAETIVRAFLSKIEATDQRIRLLDEIETCVETHLTGLQASWSPRGLWHLALRAVASRRVEAILRRLRVAAAESTELAAAQQPRGGAA
jgi:O-antigen/teichoic acid export membrane protein/thymidylate kinase/tRNA A-37 threonylcarbamoyl transferase component Bud32